MGQTFTYLTPERVLTGPGSLDRLSGELERIGSRAFLLTTPSLSERSDAARHLEAQLGSRWVGTFGGCRQHSPASTVDAAAAEAKAAAADAIVVFGGGSVTDTAKAVALELAGSGDPPPQIAIPTTLSAGEFTPAAGITDDTTRVKGLRAHPGILPRVVVLDPDATVHTQAALWLSTGVKALDHALEALWSPRPHPMCDALALEAVRRLVTWLPQSRDPEARQARGECQIAAWMSIAGMMNVGVRLSHPLGHQIGARWDVPHGVTSCIVLPAVMRELAPRALDAQLSIADALGIDVNALSPERAVADAADRLERFIAALDVPTRLRDTAAVRGEIPLVAAAVAEELERFGRLAELEDGERTLIRLLESVW